MAEHAKKSEVRDDDATSFPAVTESLPLPTDMDGGQDSTQGNAPFAPADITPAGMEPDAPVDEERTEGGRAEKKTSGSSKSKQSDDEASGDTESSTGKQ